MPTHLYLTAHINAKRVRLLRSNFLAYWNSLGLSGGCDHWSNYSPKLKLKTVPTSGLRKIADQNRSEFTLAFLTLLNFNHN